VRLGHKCHLWSRLCCNLLFVPDDGGHPTVEEKKKLYNTYAGAYEERTRGYTDFLVPHYDRFLGLLSGQRILDLGCGPGRDSAVFAARGYEPLCVDLSDEMLKRCRLRGLSTLQMNIEELELPEGSFHGAWSYTSLTTIPKEHVWRALEVVRKSLVDGGVLFLGLIEGEGECWKPADEKYAMPRFISRYQADEVIDVLEPQWELLDHSKLSSEVTGRNTYLHFLLRPTE